MGTPKEHLIKAETHNEMTQSQRGRNHSVLSAGADVRGDIDTQDL